MKNELVFIVEFDVKPEAQDEFRKSLIQLAEDMSKEETFVSAYFHQKVENENVFVMYERWSEHSFEDFIQNQLKGKAYREIYESKVPDWLNEDRKVTLLKPLNGWTHK